MRKFLFLFYCVLFFSCSQSESTENLDDRPNILLIYIDDLGYSDLGCYGSAYGNDFIETINIDRFAKEGIQFTNAYAGAPLCSPSRVAILTGKSPARMGFEFVTKFEKDELAMTDEKWRQRFKDFKLISPRYTLNLPLEEVTLAEMLNESGYDTGLVGKWHVAAHHLRYKGWSPTHGPSQQGFSTAIETYGAHPYGFDKNEKQKKYDQFYPVDRLTEESIGFIKKKRSKPFFLMVSHYYVHTPLDSNLTELIEKYRAKSNGKESEERIKYAAFVELMDHYVGQLLDALDEAGLQDNTLVVLTSDNGGHPNFAYNRPFRGSKWNLYEGGIRVPFIMRWPGKIEPNRVSDKPIIQTDLMATFADVSNNTNSKAGSDDSRSILPFVGEHILNEVNHLSDERSLYWHFPYYHPEGRKFDIAPSAIGIEDGYTSQTRPQSAIRKGKFKLIYFYEDERSELYDLQEDISEQNDVYDKYPVIGRELKDNLLNYLHEVDARLPINNNHY